VTIVDTAFKATEHGRVRLGILSLAGAMTLAGTVVFAHQGHALTTSSTTTSSSSTSLPADKVTTSGSTLQTVPNGSDTTLLSTQVKTSTPEDLLLDVTLECSILTSVTTTGSSSSSASGTINVWVTVDGNRVPVDHTVATSPTNSTVTFCRRDATQTFTDGDQGTTSGDTLTEYLNTKDANGFNWANFDTGGSGQIHTVAVHATLTTSTSGNANATGYVGNRTLTVFPTKLGPNAG